MTTTSTAGELLALRRRHGGGFTFHYWNGVGIDLRGMIILLLLVAGIGIWWQLQKRRTPTVADLSKSGSAPRPDGQT